MRPRVDDTPQPLVEQHRPAAGDATASVRLTRKYAEMIDGVDLTDANVGDELKLTEREADVLVAEGWAERSPRTRRADDVRSVASETSPSRRGPKRQQP